MKHRIRWENKSFGDIGTLNDDDRADLYADNSLANEEWTAK